LGTPLTVIISIKNKIEFTYYLSTDGLQTIPQTSVDLRHKNFGDPWRKQMRNCWCRSHWPISCAQRLKQVGKNSGRVYVCKQMCVRVLF